MEEGRLTVKRKKFPSMFVDHLTQGGSKCRGETRVAAPEITRCLVFSGPHHVCAQPGSGRRVCSVLMCWLLEALFCDL